MAAKKMFTLHSLQSYFNQIFEETLLYSGLYCLDDDNLKYKMIPDDSFHVNNG